MKNNSFILLLALLTFSACTQPGTSDTRSIQSDSLGYHPIYTYPDGTLAPWNAPTEAEAYDNILDRLWCFLDTMRTDNNGLPYYMTHLVFRESFNDYRGMGGDQFAMFLSSFNQLYPYMGNERIKELSKFIADWYLSHSLSPDDALWPNIPFPYATLMYSAVFDGDMIIGKGYTQPDKAGSFGLELVRLYKMTGLKIYLHHARLIADCLVKNLRQGNAEQSPWPFKVNAYTGEVGTLVTDDAERRVVAKSDYTTNYAPTLELFFELTALNQGDTTAYQHSANQVINWMEEYPLQNNKWGPFFEDVTGWSDTQINAVTYAQFLMKYRQRFPQWQQQVQNIFQWVYQELGNPQWEQYGVTAINEQTWYRVPGNSHTARQGAAQLQYSTLTGDTTYLHNSRRQLTWSTYWVDHNGVNCYPFDCVWFTDGYGDFIRHYLAVIALLPHQYAVPSENHLLSSTSVIQHTEYPPEIDRFQSVVIPRKANDSTVLVYRTFDDFGEEVVHLTSKPTQVYLASQSTPEGLTQGSRWEWTPLPQGNGLLRIIRDKCSEVRVEQ